jgi:hypothetical protein
VCICIYRYVGFQLLCQLKKTRHSDTLELLSTFNIHILVSKIILQLKKPWLLGEIVNSRTKVRNLQDQSVASYGTRK